MNSSTDFNQDPYAILGVPRTADDNQIKRAYFQAVRVHPPERDPEGFQRIRKAYERIRTAEDRAQTDLFLLQPPPETPKRRRPSYELSLSREGLALLVREMALHESD